jgi:acyl-homoserine lactone acylase PvdQ
MIVDFGATDSSVGVYPGGQSDSPDNPHYADLMPLWEKGDYIPLHAVDAPGKLPWTARTKQIRFRP